MANGQMNALHKAQMSPLMCLSLRIWRVGGKISTDTLLSNSAAPASKCYYGIVGDLTIRFGDFTQAVTITMLQ